MKVAHNVTCTEPNDFSEKCFKITKLAVTIHITEQEKTFMGEKSCGNIYFTLFVNISVKTFVRTLKITIVF